jgi:hypothetical protein
MTLARFWPFFELATTDAGDSGHWHSLSELFEPGLRPDPATTWLRTVASGPVPLRTSEPLVPASPDEAVEHLVLPLASAVSRQFRLSMRILLGNTAAAVVGACHVVSQVETGLAGEASALRERMLSAPLLRDTGTTSGPFVRASCCLIYRLPMDYICNSCILVSRHTPTAQRIAEGITPARRMSAQRGNIDFGQPPFR